MDERMVKRDGGYLSPAAEKRLLGDGDLDQHVKRLLLFREYNARKDAVEYTVFFYDRSDQKRRVDFDVDMKEALALTAADREDFVSRKARAEIMKEIDSGNV